MVSIGDCSGVSVAAGLDGAELSDLEMLESVVNVLSSWLLERTEPSWDLLEEQALLMEYHNSIRSRRLTHLKEQMLLFENS